MFDIGWSEIVVIAVVALIAIGPKELPAVLRTVGQYMGKIRRMASEFQGQFQEAMREAEMADLKKQVDEITDTAKGLTDFDPIADVRKEIESFSADPLAEPSPEPSAASPEAAAPIAAAPPDVAVPQPAPEGAVQADVTVAEDAPQPKDATGHDAKAGSGA
jgi:sec-independent protein translocase protein TatB